MSLKNLYLRTIAFALLLSLTGFANAAFVFTIQRVSDVDAIISGVGDANFGDQTVTFENDVVSGPGFASVSYIANGFMIGSSVLDNLEVSGGGNFLGLDMLPAFSAGAVISGGPVEATLPAGYAWASVGSTGSVDSLNGTWEMVAPSVPVPATVWLFGAGIFGVLGFARRNRT